MSDPRQALRRYSVHRNPGGAGARMEWECAEVLRDFRFPWEDRAAPGTEFRALWDEIWFRFRFVCEDGDLVLGEGSDAREKVMGSDRAEIFFARDLALDPYFALEVDPRGEVLDYEARHYRRMNWEWTFPGLEVKAGIRAGGYEVEGGIPLAVLRDLGVLHPGSGMGCGDLAQSAGREGELPGPHLLGLGQRPGERSMLAGIFRAEFHREGAGIHQGWMSWVDPGTERPDFHVPGAFGLLDLVGEKDGS